MKAKFIFAIFFLVALSFIETGCNGKSGNTAETDSIDSEKMEKPEPVADAKINQATRFYAGISCDSIEMTPADSKSWEQYSNNLKQMLTRTEVITKGLDSIARTDFSDFRDKVDFVLYPFSGADVIYPTLIYPNADTYFLCGLEKTGKPITGELKTSFAHYEAYRNALTTFLRSGFFVTKDMQDDLHNEELDGICPVLSMLMAIRGYDIISIKQMKLNEAGDFMPTDSTSNAIEFKFFKHGSRHEQTLYYLSGDIQNAAFNANMKAYLDKTLPNHTVGTYLKAASFLLRWDSFSTMRDYILNNSLAVVQDDTGVPYRILKEKFDITLYGKYKYPSKQFGSQCGQPDLEEVYKENAASIHPLPFLLGYVNSHNLICGRKKGGAQQ